MLHGVRILKKTRRFAGCIRFSPIPLGPAEHDVHKNKAIRGMHTVLPPSPSCASKIAHSEVDLAVLRQSPRCSIAAEGVGAREKIEAESFRVR